MRLRLRVPSDDEQKPTGLRAWFQSLFGGGHPPPPPASRPPAGPPPIVKPDNRWKSRGNARYFPAGRLCVHSQGLWQSEYVFAINMPAQPPQNVRIVLPEPAVAAWERLHDSRMSEAARLSLVTTTLESLIDLQRLPDSMHVPDDAIAALKPMPLL